MCHTSHVHLPGAGQPVRALSEVGFDGLAAWRAAFDSVVRHMESQQSMLPMIGLALLVLLVIWVDYRIARRLLGTARLKRQRPGSGEGS